MDQYCVLILLFLFNPIVTSLRALQQASELKADCCYVMDRWYAEFKFFNDIHARQSSYVCRLRDNSNWELVEDERPLPEAAK